MKENYWRFKRKTSYWGWIHWGIQPAKTPQIRSSKNFSKVKSRRTLEWKNNFLLRWKNSIILGQRLRKWDVNSKTHKTKLPYSTKNSNLKKKTAKLKLKCHRRPWRTKSIAWGGSFRPRLINSRTRLSKWRRRRISLWIQLWVEVGKKMFPILLPNFKGYLKLTMQTGLQLHWRKSKNLRQPNEALGYCIFLCIIRRVCYARKGNGF